MARPYFAIRVIVFHHDGSTSQRDYVRGSMRLSRSAFRAFAIGDMLALIMSGYTDTLTYTDVRLNLSPVGTVTVETLSSNEACHCGADGCDTKH